MPVLRKFLPAIHWVRYLVSHSSMGRRYFLKTGIRLFSSTYNITGGN